VFDPSISRRCFVALAASASVSSAFGLDAMPIPATGGALSLAGDWRFRLDRDDAGQHREWHHKTLAGDDKIQLPGILQTQGFGDEITAETAFVAALPRDMAWYKRPEYARYTKPGQVKVPYLSQPVRHYLGVAWYEREIEIPANWSGQRVELFLERTRWETTVYLDGRKIGSCHSLVTPHAYDLGIVPAGRHRLSIRIDNRMIFPYRPDGHSVSDAEGGTWNGIVGRIELRPTPPVWLDDVQVFPDLKAQSAEVRVRIGNIGGRPGSGTLTIGTAHSRVSWQESGGETTMHINLRGTTPWSEFTPELVRIRVVLASNKGIHERTVSFGMREIKAVGKQIHLNGELLCLRATHDGGGFPLTGYPPTDIASWKRIFHICQELGMNGMRFHSWCPPEAAFDAADEMGFYLQPECGMWNAFERDGKMLALLNEETERLLKAYGNHPSMILLNATNEPAGSYNAQLPHWDRKWRAADPRRLYADGTGRPAAPDINQTYACDYLVMNRPPASRAPGRGPAGWFGGDYEEGLHEVPVPVIGHETGQWCAYPNFDVIGKFSGYMVPGNYEIWRDAAKENGILNKNRELAHASGRFQLACYKEEIEANLRTPSYSGYELLDLHDYLGQGGALIGVLDPFWESKGYATPAEYRQFNSATVLLARLKERVLTAADTLRTQVEIAHYGPKPLANARPVWKIVADSGRVMASGQWEARSVPRGKNQFLGDISVDLSPLPAPARYKLVVELKGEVEARNEWNFWLYPKELRLPAPSNVIVTHDWQKAEKELAHGGRVLFQPDPNLLSSDTPKMSTVPIFWNRLMNPEGAWMLGLLCTEKHPALAEFPTDAHCDWQWIDIVHDAPAIRLNQISAEIDPIVQPIDDWNRSWKLGLLFECRVGAGTLMVCSIDLDADRPGTESLRQSIVNYMSGSLFSPAAKVEVDKLRAVFHPGGPNDHPQMSPDQFRSPDLDDPGQILGTPRPL
jgi:beta-galactosidase